MARLLMGILWPSFLVAIVAEGVFFSVFDPAELVLRSTHDAMSPQAVYTLGFFFFWAIGALAGGLSRYLERDDSRLSLSNPASRS